MFILKKQTLLKTRSGISCAMLQYFKFEHVEIKTKEITTAEISIIKA